MSFTPTPGGAAFCPNTCSRRACWRPFTACSERLFYEQLAYNLLWPWFLNREFAWGSFSHHLFARNYQHALAADVAKYFFVGVYDLSRQEGWASDEHFAANGTLVES